MSNILSAIYDDIEEYVFLCRKYGEKPVCDLPGPNPYCQHARELKERNRKEYEAASKLRRKGLGGSGSC